MITSTVLEVEKGKNHVKGHWYSNTKDWKIIPFPSDHRNNFFFSLLGYSTSMNKILLWNILFYKNSGLTKMGHPVVYLGSRSSALSEHSRNRRHTREVIQREVSPHIYNENTESQRGELSCPRSPKQWVVDSRGLKPGKQVYSETSSFLFFPHHERCTQHRDAFSVPCEVWFFLAQRWEPSSPLRQHSELPRWSCCNVKPWWYSRPAYTVWQQLAHTDVPSGVSRLCCCHPRPVSPSPT